MIQTDSFLTCYKINKTNIQQNSITIVRIVRALIEGKCDLQRQKLQP